MKSLILILLTGLVSFVATAQSPVVQAHLQPTNNIMVGQPVRLAVTVYVPNYFTGSPDFPEFEIENAVVVMPQDRPENSNTQIGGVRYAGITETYVIYPQQAGDILIPAASIAVPYAIEPPKSATVRVHLPALTFHADVPVAARDLDYFLPTTSLTIQQKWSVPLKNIRVGDSIERTITVTASKMQAMLIPPLPLKAGDGIRIYPEDPIVQDQKTSRGDFIFGRRIQSAKYFIQKEGEYTLPPIELKWWNLSTNRLLTAILPAIRFSAAPNPGYVTELPPAQETEPVTPAKPVSPWKRYRSLLYKTAAFSIAAFLLLWLAWHLVPGVVRRLRLWNERRSHSESAYFGHFQSACEHNDAAQSYTLLLRWLALAYPGRSLEQVIRGQANSALYSEVNALGAAVFAYRGQNHWNGRRLSQLLNQLRNSHPSHSVEPQHLSELNSQNS